MPSQWLAELVLLGDIWTISELPDNLHIFDTAIWTIL